MRVKKSTLQTYGFIIVAIIVVFGVINLLHTTEPTVNNNPTDSTATITSDGKQIIDLTAKGGYSPKIIQAKANLETILRVSTNNTFDCSSALTIPKLKVNKNLPPTGKTEIAIAPQSAGTEIDGTCSMGMYSFKIKFS